MEELLNQIREKYPFVKLWAYESPVKIELQQIEVDPEYRGQGIGSEIIRILQNYAKSVGKPIVLRPEAERGRKKDLERFYKDLGFVHNKGKHIDYSLTSPMAKTMYWRFKEWLNESTTSYPSSILTQALELSNTMMPIELFQWLNEQLRNFIKVSNNHDELYRYATALLGGLPHVLTGFNHDINANSWREYYKKLNQMVAERGLSFPEWKYDRHTIVVYEYAKRIIQQI
jgi:hypothetical protein